jgi:hypothetical protein
MVCLSPFSIFAILEVMWLGGCLNVSFDTVARLKSWFPQEAIERDDNVWAQHQDGLCFGDSKSRVSMV